MESISLYLMLIYYSNVYLRHNNNLNFLDGFQENKVFSSILF